MIENKIYLILDSNIWIYMSSGYNIQDGTENRDLHIKVFNSLVEKLKNRKIVLLVNDIIIKEFKHKVDVDDSFTISSKKKIKNILNCKNQIEKDVNKSERKELNVLINRIKKRITDESDKYKQHKFKVENFIEKECEVFKIDIKSISEFVHNLYLESKAPFQKNGKGDSDAKILYGSLDYLKKKDYVFSAIFVSNNTKDFKGKSNNTFHPDIKEHIDKLEFPVKYENNFSKFIDLSEDEISNLENALAELSQQLYNEEMQTIFSCLGECNNSNMATTCYGYFENLIRVSSNHLEVNHDRNQINMFDYPNIDSLTYSSVSAGKCDCCNSIHITCPNCSTLNMLIDNEYYLICQNCESEFCLERSQLYNDIIIINSNLLN